MSYSATVILANIALLESSLATGEAEVEYQGRRVRYKTQPEILAGINYFRSLLTEVTPGRPKQSFGVSSKGF